MKIVEKVIVTLELQCAKHVPDLAALVAQRAFTLDGVEEAVVIGVTQAPHKGELVKYDSSIQIKETPKGTLMPMPPADRGHDWCYHTQSTLQMVCSQCKVFSTDAESQEQCTRRFTMYNALVKG